MREHASCLGLKMLITHYQKWYFKESKGKSLSFLDHESIEGCEVEKKWFTYRNSIDLRASHSFYRRLKSLHATDYIHSRVFLSLNFLGFPCGSDGKESACKEGDLGPIPGSGRSLEEWNGNPFQYSWLENPMDRGAWRVTVHGVTKSQTLLSD